MELYFYYPSMPTWRGQGRLYLYLLCYNLFMYQYIVLEGGYVCFKCVTVCLETNMSRDELRMGNKDKGHPRTGYEGLEGEWRYSCTLYLPSALDGEGGNSTPRPLYPPGKRAGIHCTGGWVGSRAGLDGAENLASTGIRYPDRQDCSESLFSRNM